MNKFKKEYDKFLDEFGKGRKMVLSSSENDRVSSRLMSIVQMNGNFYFQTDKTFKKYSQIVNNPNCALCIDNIQMEGICKEIGHPMSNIDFCNIYQECFNTSYEKYSSIGNERLFMFTPTYLERWIYINDIPFLELYEIERKIYKLAEYKTM